MSSGMFFSQFMPQHGRLPSPALTALCCASQLFVVCPISRYLLFVWGWWQSNKLPLGGMLWHVWKIPAGAALQKRSVLCFLSHHPRENRLQCFWRNRTEISPHRANEAHWAQRRQILGKIKHSENTCAKPKPHQCSVSAGPDPKVLWPQTNSNHRDRNQLKHSPRIAHYKSSFLTKAVV